MRKALVSMMAALVLTGCISSAPKSPSNWTIGVDRARALDSYDYGEGEIGGVLRVLSVQCRAPYDDVRLAVLRADGSIAFDSYNVFAASPASLLKGAALDLFAKSGRFAAVVANNSSVQAAYSAEIAVEELALDCRKEGRRDASVRVAITLVKGRDIAAISRADAKSSAAAGDYSAAFSRAFADAMAKAIAQLNIDK